MQSLSLVLCILMAAPITGLEILIADQENHRIQKCDISSPGSDCTTVAGGSQGSSLTELNSPTGVALNGDDMFICDFKNDRVLKCPLSSPGDPCTLFDDSHGGPTTVTVDENGNVIYTSYSDNALVVCSPQASCELWTSSTSGYTAKDLDSPTGVAVDTDGGYLVADMNNQRVQKCSAKLQDCSTVAGDVVNQAHGPDVKTPTLAYPAGVAVDTDGSYIVASMGYHKILKCSKSSSSSCTTVAGDGTADKAPNRFDTPTGVVLHPDGDYLVVDNANNRVQKCPSAAPGACTTVAGSADGKAGDTAKLLHTPPAIFLLTTTTTTTTIDNGNNQSDNNTNITTTGQSSSMLISHCGQRYDGGVIMFAVVVVLSCMV